LGSHLSEIRKEVVGIALLPIVASLRDGCYGAFAICEKRKRGIKGIFGGFMIVTFPWPIKTKSGKNYERTLIYQSYDNDSVCVARLYAYPRLTAHNHEIGSKLSQANVLYKEMNRCFREELKIYAEAFDKQLCKEKKLPPHYYHIFIKALCKGFVKIEELESLEGFVGIYGNNIEAWIANGLLPEVKARFLGIAVWLGE